MITNIRACETGFKGNLLDRFKREAKPRQIPAVKKTARTFEDSFDEFNKNMDALETHVKTKPWKVRQGVTLLSKTLFWGFIANIKY